MAMDFKQSETMKNLMRAFAGESQARNRYTFAAAQANNQGLYVIEHIFKFTADQEKEHAEVFYNQLKELAGETIHIDGGYPVPFLLLHHKNPALKDYVWHWFNLAGYEAAEEAFRVKAVTYGEAEWLDFAELWETGFEKKGGMILLAVFHCL